MYSTLDKKKRGCFIATFVLAVAGVSLLSVSMATDYMVVAKPVKLVDQATVNSAKNVTGHLDTKFRGKVNFGLFHGYKELDHGLGVRKGEIKVYCAESENLCGLVGESFETRSGKDAIQHIIDTYSIHEQRSGNEVNGTVTEEADNGLFTFGLWVATIVMICMAIAWGLVAMGFAVLNASTKPIETITGPVGLYLWNLFAMLFAMAAFIMYLVLFVLDLRKNVLSLEDRETYQWTSDGRADLHYSFYLVVLATVLFGVNIILVFCSGVECKTVKYRSSVNEKALEGVMMY